MSQEGRPLKTVEQGHAVGKDHVRILREGGTHQPHAPHLLDHCASKQACFHGRLEWRGKAEDGVGFKVLCECILTSRFSCSSVDPISINRKILGRS